MDITHIIVYSVWLILSILERFEAQPRPQPRRVVCYYTNWAQYRTGQGSFEPRDINAKLCTHLVYAHAGVNVNFTIRTTEWNDLPSHWSTGMYPQFIGLKNENPKLKTMISAGGYALSPSFAQIVQTKGTRAVFIESAIRFMRDWGFDGLDIMWEYPTKRGSKSSDKQKFSKLLQETRESFRLESTQTGSIPLILSATVAATKDIIDDAYEIGTVTEQVDFLNLLTYDFHGHWDGWTGHCAPLYGRADEQGSFAYNNVNASVNYWMENGTPPSKINVGISPYARTFTIDVNNNTLPGRPSIGPGRPGKISHDAGGLTYYEICDIARDADIFWDDIQKVPFMVYNNQWISFDNERSINEKLKFIKNRSIGGVMFWNMPSDDFFNSCGSGRFPMLSTLHKQLVGNSIPAR
ncbi:chitotriosidase-1 [Patella vulgata]|uniref:chitotriosidase-1 n=1 Tax=Patella vulgata TaxID=6465 RepID=UPI002180303B|nr:chitotriosidase-1 [Patella vulgata]